ncbi:MAG: hypothetical protein NC925_00350 [Candidatus Omnitrophica bacterium]|nr:hypothetical protein [Candidatus Omnitrophota bacterium]MCM8831273.1 hypothetical protein [Candidatus Omnitrophota bacterium]
MSDKPLILSILVGLIVVLVIAGVSLLVKINALDENYKKELTKNIELQKNLEELKNSISTLKEENVALKEKNTQLTTQVEELKIEKAKLEKLKEKLEENLKEELMKNTQAGN